MALATIYAANLAFERRVGDRLELPIAVLLEQRDAAFRELLEARAAVHREKQALETEHERVIGSLLQQHQRELDALRVELDTFRGGRASAILPPARHANAPEALLDRKTTSGGMHGGNWELERAVAELRRELEAANAEIEATRQDVVRIQADCNEALRAADDQRLALQIELDNARDQSIEIQAALDEALHQLDDTRDHAREDQARLQEEIAELRRVIGPFAST